MTEQPLLRPKGAQGTITRALLREIARRIAVTVTVE